MNEKKSINRRNFPGITTWTIGGLISAGMEIPAIAYIIGPAQRSTKTQSCIRLGSAAKVKIGTPTLFKAKIERKTGWGVGERECGGLDHRRGHLTVTRSKLRTANYLLDHCLR